MCGRYVITWQPDEISERFQLRRLPEGMFQTYMNFNAAPTQELPVIVVDESGERVLRPMRWGLRARWSKPGDTKAPAPFNARAESVLEKPMFRNLVKSKRCLVPARGYFEWQNRGDHKQPFLIGLPGDPLIAFAGLYDEFVPQGEEEPVASYTILTTDATEFAGQFHTRMPVILEPEDEADWVDPANTDVMGVLPMAHGYEGEMEAYPVSRAVNNVRNNDPSLLEPIEDPDGEEAEQADLF
ncbi:MAG TPA: SOS response-associated peptidase [Thermomicrobiales bacterium]|nr:SOS response-associated peptidase [Thermomicrobiales bacterium]